MKMLKTLPLLLPALALALIVGACGGGSSTPTESGTITATGGEATQEVCHLAQTRIDVLIENLEEHIQHGDWLIGPEVCDNQDNDCDGAVDEGGVCDGNKDGGD